ncbi:zinc-ribbon domain-containing protein [uncultured Gemmiger sp.]|uniref:DUF7577 domain-containing protein n=1 Tax=uncultured Gemmiger sp. TaxID=1623490 RepID=UPI0025F43CFA|nr:zinc-ribbon domain-containing protein [uncultured Gemmiger sp.]
MKSIKPGRGPSGMEVVFGVFSVAFGVFWTVLAFSMTRGLGLFGLIFPLFGVFFVVMGLIRTAYSIHNAFGKNRYSEYDITDDGEEPDPFDPRNAHREDMYRDNAARSAPYGAGSSAPAGGFCPYCGAPVEADYEFCRRCGKKLS